MMSEKEKLLSFHGNRMKIRNPFAPIGQLLAAFGLMGLGLFFCWMMEAFFGR